jgi:hypothetical protein
MAKFSTLQHALRRFFKQYEKSRFLKFRALTQAFKPIQTFIKAMTNPVLVLSLLFLKKVPS